MNMVLGLRGYMIFIFKGIPASPRAARRSSPFIRNYIYIPSNLPLTKGGYKCIFLLDLSVACFVRIKDQGSWNGRQGLRHYHKEKVPYDTNMSGGTNE